MKIYVSSINHIERDFSHNFYYSNALNYNSHPSHFSLFTSNFSLFPYHS